MTTPPEVMLAVPVPETIDHTPEAVASVNAGVVEFTQTEAAPPPTDNTSGALLMVIAFLTVVVQPLLLTV